jgi:hypothetical protein
MPRPRALGLRIAGAECRGPRAAARAFLSEQAEKRQALNAQVGTLGGLQTHQLEL